jgi:hypothetical protein
VQNSGTTIELDKDAKASLAKEMKGKDYDLEGIESRSSKRTHRTNMTGKTGMTSNRSVTTKKYALHFSQQKKDLNEEQKKTAASEQRLREMESALSTGIPPVFPHSTNPLPPTSKSVRISDHFTQSDKTLSQKFDSLLNLPPPTVTLLLNQAAIPLMMWVGGVKCPLVSPLLKVDIGG